ncbi:MAG TPA: hypothetical protein DCP22_00085, partial [Ruminococcaceae bacterium]|nr:hypothetical protein [Oscillospiraceae bacterium]
PNGRPRRSPVPVPCTEPKMQMEGMKMAAQSELYRDIATRTGGDIYIGVVGPV